MRNEYRVTWKLYQSWLVENMLRMPSKRIPFCKETVQCIS